jgi:hypothetical protein
MRNSKNCKIVTIADLFWQNSSVVSGVLMKDEAIFGFEGMGCLTKIGSQVQVRLYEGNMDASGFDCL